MEFNRGATDLDFEQALLHESRLGAFDMVYSFLDRGRYDRIVENVQRIFRPENVLFIKTEELLRQPDQMLPDIQDFMGVSRVNLEHKETFKGSYGSEMDQETRWFLEQYFAESNERFSALTGIEVADWMGSAKPPKVDLTPLESTVGSMEALLV